MRIGIIQTFMDYHRRGLPNSGPLQTGIGPLIAGCLPEHEDIHIVHESLGRPDWTREYDLLFISCLHSEFDRARQISHYWRRRGATTVLGGTIASTYPQLCAPYFDSIAVGDGESVIPRIYEDFKQHGRLQRVYTGGSYRGENMPVPRFDLIGSKQMVPLSFEVTRGCPFQCDFCSLSAIGTRFHTRPLETLVRDVDAGRRMLRGKVPDWKLKIAMLLDNNIAGSMSYHREFCRTMETLDLQWAAAITFNAVSNKECVRMMAQAGARMLFTGLESFNPEALAEMNKHQNVLDDTRRAVDLCHENGIALISALLLNAKVDTVEYIRSIPRKLEESGLMVPAFFAFECPLPGTPLFHRMASAPQPAFLPNALLCDFNGNEMVLRPERETLQDFVGAYKETLAEVTSAKSKLKQIWTNAPGFLQRGQYSTALTDAFLHWSAVFRKPVPGRTYITGTDVPMPELFDVPFTDADFRTEEERRMILEPWRITDSEGRVLPQWRSSDRVYGSKGLINPELLARKAESDYEFANR